MKNAWPFMRSLYKLFKDKSSKPVALESVRFLLDAYCTKFAARDPELTNRLTELSLNVFPNAKVRWSEKKAARRKTKRC